MKRSLSTFGLAALLITAASGACFAQTANDLTDTQPLVAPEGVIAPMATQEVAPELDSGIPAGALGASVKFTNDGANRPVLETLSPDAEGIEFDPSVADYLGQFDKSLDQVEDMNAESSGLPQFDITTYPKQIFWLTLVFGLLYFINARRILPALKGSIEGRAARIAADIETAEQLREQADAMRDAYESAIATAQQEGHKTLAELQARIKADMEAEGVQFKERADVEVKALQERLDSARERIKDELNDSAVALTVDIAKAVAGIEPADKDAKAAVDSFINTTTAKAA